MGGLAVRRFGQGEPLVLIHGIGHHWRAWEPVIADLATTNDVLPNAKHVDLTGCGHVPMSDDPQQVADVIRATISAE